MLKNIYSFTNNMLITGSWSNGLSATEVKKIKEILSPITILKALMLAIVGAVGVFFFIRGLWDFSQSLQQTDQTGMGNAIRGMIAGFLMAAVSIIVALLGF